MDGEGNHGRDSRDRERRRRKKVTGDVESRNVASSERSSERSRRSGQTRPRDMTRTKSKESQKSTRSKSRENTTTSRKTKREKSREKSGEKPREISKSKSRERPNDQDNQKDKSITRRKRVSGRRPRTAERTSGSNLEVITVCGRQFRTKPEVAKKSQKSKTKKVCDNDTLKNGEPGRRNIHDRIKGLQDQSQGFLESTYLTFDMTQMI